eukprot:COSAG02_NODE_34294_length_486_cov_0.868217_1_plen_78_part_00
MRCSLLLLLLLLLLSPRATSGVISSDHSNSLEHSCLIESVHAINSLGRPTLPVFFDTFYIPRFVMAVMHHRSLLAFT